MTKYKDKFYKYTYDAPLLYKELVVDNDDINWKFVIDFKLARDIDSYGKKYLPSVFMHELVYVNDFKLSYAHKMKCILEDS